MPLLRLHADRLRDSVTTRLDFTADRCGASAADIQRQENRGDKVGT